MAINTYRCNLKATSVPQLANFSGRTVIMRNQDHNYVPGLVEKSSSTEADTTIGVPQLMYCHNVVPTYAGYKSVGFKNILTTIPTIDNYFVDRVFIRDGLGHTAEIGVTATGQLFILKRGETYWSGVVGAPPIYEVQGKKLTAAFVSGLTYIYVEALGCYVYEFASATLIPVTLTGLDPTTIIGVVGCFGYLLAYSADAFAWSSTVDPTEFTPDLATGAGGGQVEGAKGNIVSVVLMTNYLVVFTTTNAVAAQYTANSRFPFQYSEIAGCGGLYDGTYVTGDSTGTILYAYTTSGLQSITARQATVIYPEVTDFLSGRRFQDFDTSTYSFVDYTLSTVVTPKRVILIADRYLVISYSITGELPFTHAVVFDIVMKQFTRFKITHMACFEFMLYEQDSVEVPKDSFAFLLQSGMIQVVDFSLDFAQSNGVAIFGRYQHSRSKMINLHAVEVETLESTDVVECTVLSALHGKDFTSHTAGYLAHSEDGLRVYNFDVVGTNVSVLFKGKFNLSTMVLQYTTHGRV